MAIRNLLKWISLVLVLPLILTLYGCPKDMAISLYNNSSTDWVVRFADGESQWRAGYLLRLGDNELNRLSWSVLQGTNKKVPTLDLVGGSKSFRYSLKEIYALPPEYVENEHETQMRLQMEADDFLYAVRTEQQLPVADPRTQPTNFPLRPSVP